MSKDSSYTFVRRIASGGMGEVSLVVRRSEDFRRLYAMKRLKGAAVEDPALRRLFKDEARLCGLLQHSNVVSVLDVQEDDQGPFMLMNYIHGMTAGQIISGCRSAEVLPPVQVAVRLMLDVARGLSAAHDLRGSDGNLLEVVHRDISPPNVLVGFDGVARVSDFGVARSELRSSQTETGVLKGKLSYMAPEQLRFESASVQTDLFALGVVFFEVLTCTRLYQAKSAAETARMIFDEPMPDIADVRTDVHPSIVALLFRLLAKDPQDRPRSAAEVAEFLENVLTELASIEGTLSVREFLEQRFAEQKKALDEMVQAALGEVAARPPPAANENEGTLVADSPVTSARGRTMALAAVAAVAAVLLAVGGWWAFVREVDPIVPTEASPAPELSNSTPEAPVPTWVPEFDPPTEAEEQITPDAPEDDFVPTRRAGGRGQVSMETPQPEQPTPEGGRSERRGRAVQSLRGFGGSL